MTWINIFNEIKWLKKTNVHLIQKNAAQTLIEQLKKLNFELFFIDGKNICTETDFFIEIAKSLGFPDYFGNNWDAFYDCLGDFEPKTSKKFAIIWQEADLSLNNSKYFFLKACFELVTTVNDYKNSKNPDRLQMEVFFLGEDLEFEQP